MHLVREERWHGPVASVIGRHERDRIARGSGQSWRRCACAGERSRGPTLARRRTVTCWRRLERQWNERISGQRRSGCRRGVVSNDVEGSETHRVGPVRRRGRQGRCVARAIPPSRELAACWTTRASIASIACPTMPASAEEMSWRSEAIRTPSSPPGDEPSKPGLSVSYVAKIASSDVTRGRPVGVEHRRAPPSRHASSRRESVHATTTVAGVVARCPHTVEAGRGSRSGEYTVTKWPGATGSLAEDCEERPQVVREPARQQARRERNRTRRRPDSSRQRHVDSSSDGREARSLSPLGDQGGDVDPRAKIIGLHRPTSSQPGAGER